MLTLGELNATKGGRFGWLVLPARGDSSLTRGVSEGCAYVASIRFSTTIAPVPGRSGGIGRRHRPGPRRPRLFSVRRASPPGPRPAAPAEAPPSANRDVPKLTFVSVTAAEKDISWILGQFHHDGI